MTTQPAVTPATPSTLLDAQRHLRFADWLILIGFCLVLFGYSMFSGRPLSLHEARLPQCSREMMANGDWLIPRSGGRPWLERPPLPHWLTIAASALLGQHCDKVWAVRLAAAVMGCITVLMTAWIATRLRGRAFGLVAGLVMATGFEFYTYSCLAEDDIFLAAVLSIAMACFVASEFDRDGNPRAPETSIAGKRRWPVLGFFAALGLSNMIKGPLVGTAVVGMSVAVWVLWGNLRTLRRYLWLWGWLVFLALAAFWPVMVARRYPEILQNWFFDYGGTSQYDQPFWYYPVILLGALAPWTPAALVGLWDWIRDVRKQPSPAQKLILSWAMIPLLILSIPHRKHHHYLVPSLAPWALLAAAGLFPIAQSMFKGPLWSRRPLFGIAAFGIPGALAMGIFHRYIPGPGIITAVLAMVWIACVALFYLGLERQRASIVLGAFLGGLAVAFCWGQTYLPDATTQDTQFLAHVESTVPASAPLMINADLRGELDFFRIGFYLRPGATLLHNLTFLRDQRITAREVFVITRAKDAPLLEQLGIGTPVLQSAKTRREKSPADRFTLFKLTFHPDLKRLPAPLPDSISTMEAMGRKKGPYCGDPLALPSQ